MIYLYEVGYSVGGANLPPSIKEVRANNPKEGEAKLQNDIPKGLSIRCIKLIGSKYIDK